MYPLRWISPVLLAALAGCASAEGAGSSAPPAPAPEVVEAQDTAPSAPAEEPDVSMEARWAAPFAVQSTGQVAAREPRPEVVRLEGYGAPAPPDTVPLVPVAVDTPAVADTAAARPAPARRDTARTAARTPPRNAGRTSPSAPPARSGRRAHEVQPGETFYAVARKYSVAPAALRAENPGVDPEKLRSGTTLWIPAASPAGSSSAAPAATPPARPADAPKPATRAARTHTVVSGDTLFGIARKYGVSAAAIRAANRMEDDVVRLGQTLVIPAAP